eukprot:6114801-Amphidinium_carterae.1
MENYGVSHLHHKWAQVMLHELVHSLVSRDLASHNHDNDTQRTTCHRRFICISNDLTTTSSTLEGHAWRNCKGSSSMAHSACRREIGRYVSSRKQRSATSGDVKKDKETPRYI